MAQLYPDSVQRLITELNRLPGIGARSAERLAFHLLAAPRDEAMGLALAIREVKHSLRACPRCFNVTDAPTCHICRDAERRQQILCVVELPRDIIALEKCGVYDGVYHVLQGRLDPLANIAPENLRIAELCRRLTAENIEEVILALNPTTAGDATTHYLAAALRAQFPALKITAPARGLTAGVDIETIATSSLAAALRARADWAE
ncbi:recombination protein RecR [Planctomycetales bacterium]|nr:recombination protein RecR [Planctomycetales bacterium]GHT05518.1 recombination protein RecR [Planctomycetales bacterium]GHV20135.1 recombination protein RecR [Planctomycetales bacterium]